MFTSRVERTISAAHHNGPPGHRCEVNHGHDWRIIVEISYDIKDLDDRGWGPDFGKIKEIIDRFDHQDMNVLMGHVPPSAENFAMWLYADLYSELELQPDFVQVYEGAGNSILYRPSQ